MQGARPFRGARFLLRLLMGILQPHLGRGKECCPSFPFLKSTEVATKGERMKKISEWPKWGRIMFYVFVAFLVLICPPLIIPLVAWWVIRRYLRWSAENRLAESAARLESGAAPAKTPFFPKTPKNVGIAVALVIGVLYAIGSCKNENKEQSQREQTQEEGTEVRDEGKPVEIKDYLLKALDRQDWCKPKKGELYLWDGRSSLRVTVLNGDGNGMYVCLIGQGVPDVEQLYHNRFVVFTKHELADGEVLPDGIYRYVGVKSYTTSMGAQSNVRAFEEVRSASAKRALEEHEQKMMEKHRKDAEARAAANRKAEEERVKAEAIAKEESLAGAKKKYAELDYCGANRIVIAKSIRDYVSVSYAPKYQKMGEKMRTGDLAGLLQCFAECSPMELWGRKGADLLDEFNKNGYLKQWPNPPYPVYLVEVKDGWKSAPIFAGENPYAKFPSLWVREYSERSLGNGRPQYQDVNLPIDGRKRAESSSPMIVVAPHRGADKDDLVFGWDSNVGNEKLREFDELEKKVADGVVEKSDAKLKIKVLQDQYFESLKKWANGER